MCWFKQTNRALIIYEIDIIFFLNKLVDFVANDLYKPWYDCGKVFLFMIQV